MLASEYARHVSGCTCENQILSVLLAVSRPMELDIAL